jgi:hypothetical protein
MRQRLLTITYQYGDQAGRILAASADPVVFEDLPAVPSGTKCLDLIGAMDEGADRSVLALARIILPIFYVTYVGLGEEFFEVGERSEAMIVVKPDAPPSVDAMDEPALLATLRELSAE